MARACFLLVALLVGVPAAAPAQSLADVAKKEAARRKTVKEPSKVLTNNDLRPVTPPAVPPPPPAEAAPADAPAGEPPAKTDEEQRADDEAAWRQKMVDARTALERNQMFLEALQSRINALWADFTARDDPAQRSQLEQDRKKALAEYERVKTEIAEQTKAIADLEEQARREGVPPGWLR